MKIRPNGKASAQHLPTGTVILVQNTDPWAPAHDHRMTDDNSVLAAEITGEPHVRHAARNRNNKKQPGLRALDYPARIVGAEGSTIVIRLFSREVVPVATADPAWAARLEATMSNA